MGATYGENRDHSRARRHRKLRPTHRRSPDRSGRQRHPCTDKEPREGKAADGVTAVTGYLGDQSRCRPRSRASSGITSRRCPRRLTPRWGRADQGDAHGSRALSDGRGGADLHGRHRPGGGGAAGQVRRVTLRPDVSDHRARGADPRAVHQIGVRIGLPVRYEQCDRAEAVPAFQTVLGPNAAWYLDQLEDAVDHPQEANGLVAELTGSPAASVA